MIQVAFHENVPDERLKFAVIAARHAGRWVFCMHKERDTYEIPGGHREPGEEILYTAKRELFEETGALSYTLAQVGAYSVCRDGEESFGMLYVAEVDTFGELPDMEMRSMCFMDVLPARWTYPDIQPRLLAWAQAYCDEKPLA